MCVCEPYQTSLSLPTSPFYACVLPSHSLSLALALAAQEHLYAATTMHEDVEDREGALLARIAARIHEHVSELRLWMDVNASAHMCTHMTIATHSFLRAVSTPCLV